MAASLPTARITPRATTTVASSSGGAETGTTLAPRMAKYCGSPPWANAGEPAAGRKTPGSSASAHKLMRSRVVRMPKLLMGTRRATDRPSVEWTDEANGKFQASQGERPPKKSAAGIRERAIGYGFFFLP